VSFVHHVQPFAGAGVTTVGAGLSHITGKPLNVNGSLPVKPGLYDMHDGFVHSTVVNPMYAFGALQDGQFMVSSLTSWTGNPETVWWTLILVGYDQSLQLHFVVHQV
jgi:hypothetical protein